MTLSEESKNTTETIFTVLCSTIAHLLTSIAEPSLRDTVRADLLALAADLARMDHHVHSELDFQILIFEQTVQASSQIPEEEEFPVHVTSSKALIFLKAAALTVLHSYLLQSRSRRLDPEDEEGGQLPAFFLHFPHILENPEYTSTVLETLNLCAQSSRINFQESKTTQYECLLLEATLRLSQTFMEDMLQVDPMGHSFVYEVCSLLCRDLSFVCTMALKLSAETALFRRCSDLMADSLGLLSLSSSTTTTTRKTCTGVDMISLCGHQLLGALDYMTKPVLANSRLCQKLLLLLECLVESPSLDMSQLETFSRFGAFGPLLHLARESSSDYIAWRIVRSCYKNSGVGLSEIDRVCQFSRLDSSSDDLDSSVSRKRLRTNHQGKVTTPAGILELLANVVAQAMESCLLVSSGKNFSAETLESSLRCTAMPIELFALSIPPDGFTRDSFLSLTWAIEFIFKSVNILVQHLLSDSLARQSWKRNVGSDLLAIHKISIMLSPKLPFLVEILRFSDNFNRLYEILSVSVENDEKDFFFHSPIKRRDRPRLLEVIPTGMRAQVTNTVAARLYGAALPIVSESDIMSVLECRLDNFTEQPQDGNCFSDYFLLSGFMDWLMNSSPDELHRCFAALGRNMSVRLLEWSLNTMLAHSMFDGVSMRAFGRVFSHDNCRILSSLFCDEKQASMIQQEYLLEDSSEVRDVAKDMSRAFFNPLDVIIAELPLSGTTSPRISNLEKIVHFLTSLCPESNLDFVAGRVVFGEAMKRIFRILGSSLSEGRPSTGLGGLAFFCETSLFFSIMETSLMNEIFPKVFSDILECQLSTKGCFEFCQQLLHLLFFGTKAQHQKSSLTNRDTDIKRTFKNLLPGLVASGVSNEDTTFLRNAALFEYFLSSSEQRGVESTKRAQGASGQLFLLSCSTRDFSSSFAFKNKDDDKIDLYLRSICSESPLVEKTLSHLIMRGRKDVNFFIRKVLMVESQVASFLESKDLLLRHFVSELGGDSGLVKQAIDGLQLAVAAKDKNLRFLSISGQSIKGRDRSQGSHFDQAKDWITNNFMYLMVNVVQHRWIAKSDRAKARSMQCLCFMLVFLKSEESQHLFPQILATVNSALGDSVVPNAELKSQKQFLKDRLSLLAVTALDKFVRIIALDHAEAVGRNLTDIIVALIPVLTESSSHSPFFHACRLRAADLCEWMVTGELGMLMSKYFAEVPFLPQTPLLDQVRIKLAQLGVDFDSNHLAQSGDVLTEHVESVEESDCPSRSSASVEKSRLGSRRGAMISRIEMLCPLIENENPGTRRVVLDHLLSLLRLNREIYSSIIENEEGSSLELYITTVNSGANVPLNGCISRLVEILLSRSRLEPFFDIKILIAKCFGELGAISPSLLERRYSKTEADVDTYDWRLQQPPWNSSAARYELRLVTRDLVRAFLASTSSAEQNKIGFSLQQILLSLDKIASPGSGGNKSGQMSGWLKDQLSEAGIYDTVEPFWSTELVVNEIPTPNQPPFFQRSANYYSWISNWTRYMIFHAYEQKKSPWTSFFHSCRMAIRTGVGLTIAEFLLPLLILHYLCYGEGHEEQIVVREVMDVLSSTEKSPIAGGDRRRAVRTLLVSLDTLEYWSVYQNELRFQSSRGIKPKGRGEILPSDGSWGVDESLMRIEELCESIPFDLRAKASFSVGMYAETVRFLERNARKEASAVVFDGKNDDSGLIPECNSTVSRSAGKFGKVDMQLLMDALGSLQDYETLSCFDSDGSSSSLTSDPIKSGHRKESRGDFEGALREYERALLLNRGNECELPLSGSLRCMLELGHFERSVVLC